MKPTAALALLGLMTGAASMAGAEDRARANPQLTMIPFVTEAFVGDKEAARLFNDLAEFSTRLLFWSDTPRAPVTAVGRAIKTAFGPFYEEWRGIRGPAPLPTAAVVTSQVSAGFLSLTSPRIIRIAIGNDVVVGPIAPVDLTGDGAAPVPFVVHNTRATSVRVAFHDAADPRRTLHSLELKPQQVLGFFCEVTPPAGVTRHRITVDAGELKGELELPLRRHGAGQVDVTVIDEQGQLTPARVYLTGADARAHAPKDVHHRIVIGDYAQPFAGDCYFHTAGRFSTELPEGQATIEVIKGMEYFPHRQTMTVKPGQRQALEIRLQRKANLAAAGWYSGDVHVHANLFAEKRISMRDTLLVAKAEDLNVVNILPCNDPRTTTINDGQFFTGRPDDVSERNYIVYVNEEMRNDLYGHVGFLNLKTFVEPAYFGWPHSPFPYDFPGNYPQAAQAKAQGAVVTYVHPGLPSEFPVDIALGVADTIDAMCQGDEEITTRLWYRLLNCGFRCPMSAGTDAFLNVPLHLIPGAGRLYVQAGANLTYEGWIEGYRQGRSFATNGPLLQFSVNGRGPGDEIRAGRGPLVLDVRGGAESIVPMDAVEIIVNGRPVKRTAAGPDKLAIRVAETIELTESAWVALRVRGPGHRLAPNDREVYAHTSPVYVSIGDQPVAVKEDALFFVDQIDILIARMDQRGVFAHAAQRDEIVRRFRAGQEIYRRMAAGSGAKLP